MFAYAHTPPPLLRKHGRGSVEVGNTGSPVRQGCVRTADNRRRRGGSPEFCLTTQQFLGGGGADTQNAGATPGGTRASTADKEEGYSKAGEATRTAGTGNQNGADGRACAWEAATIKGMAWPASPVATGCQGNPCSTGIRWGVSPAAQMGCLRNRSGSPSGADQP